MWHSDWRERIWQDIDQKWDILIVGGGITGAGVLRAAAQAGLRCLLVEGGDFASGTSSRSSKLVHGGFRYLRNRQFRVTRESVREREWLLHTARNLVTPLSFLLPNYAGGHTPEWQFSLGVFLYDIFAYKWKHRGLSREEMLSLSPYLNPDGLEGGHEYFDASVDDARLVLRILREAVQSGGTALNYCKAEDLLRTRDGQVCGVRLHDLIGERTLEVQARVVVNAAGPWSDELRARLGQPGRLRKLRGSHLIFPRQRLELRSAITLMHPRDHRALFVLPWEGITMIGTTDLDHDPALERAAEPFASAEEIEYLLEAMNQTFPSLGFTRGDIVSTFAGLRPIVRAPAVLGRAPAAPGRAGDEAPSKASRAHVVWEEEGLLTVTGGKLTIFRIMARQALEAAQSRLPLPLPKKPRIFDPHSVQSVLADERVDLDTCLLLLGRHGADACRLVDAAQAGELEPIGGSTYRWAELRWAARDEGVQHLDDLLLRRVRVGLTLPRGGLEHASRIQTVVQQELGWDEARWQAELARYQDLWQHFYSPEPGI